MVKFAKIVLGIVAFIILFIAAMGFMLAPSGEKGVPIFLVVIGGFFLFVAFKYKGKQPKSEEDMVNEAFGENSRIKDIYYTVKKENLKNKENAILNYSPARAETETLSYFQSLQNLNDLYAPSKTENAINVINKLFESLFYVKDQPGFKDAFNEGYKSFLMVTNVTIDEDLDNLKVLDNEKLQLFINACVLKQAKRIIMKNNELIEKYKNKPLKAAERYDTISDSMFTLMGLVDYTENMEGYEFMNQHEGRSRDRAHGLRMKHNQ